MFYVVFNLQLPWNWAEICLLCSGVNWNVFVCFFAISPLSIFRSSLAPSCLDPSNHHLLNVIKLTYHTMNNHEWLAKILDRNPTSLTYACSLIIRASISVVVSFVCFPASGISENELINEFFTLLAESCPWHCALHTIHNASVTKWTSGAEI